MLIDRIGSNSIEEKSKQWIHSCINDQQFIELGISYQYLLTDIKFIASNPTKQPKQDLSSLQQIFSGQLDY